MLNPYALASYAKISGTAIAKCIAAQSCKAFQQSETENGLTCAKRLPKSLKFLKIFLILGLFNSVFSICSPSLATPPADSSPGGIGGKRGIPMSSTISTAPADVVASLENLSRPDDEYVVGTGNDDRLISRYDGDVLLGLEGDDLLYGRGGNDWLEGGAGNDRLIGGEGDDVLIGGDGADVFTFGRNKMIAGDLDRVLDVDFSIGDRLALHDFDAGTFIDTRQLGGELQPLSSDGSCVVINSLSDLQQAALSDAVTLIDGGNGCYRLIITDSSGSYGVDLQLAEVSSGSASNLEPIAEADSVSGDQLLLASNAFVDSPLQFPELTTSFESLSRPASTDAKYLVGTATDDRLMSSNHGDVLLGLEGDDLLRGRRGDDWLEGGAGDDRLVGGEGDDVLIGGDGADVFTFGRNKMIAGDLDRVLDVDFSAGDRLAFHDFDAGTFIDTRQLGGELQPLSSDGSCVVIDSLSDLQQAALSAAVRVVDGGNGCYRLVITDSSGSYGVDMQLTGVSNGSASNLDPIVEADSGTTNPDQILTLDVLANDSDPDGGTVTLDSIDTSGLLGQASIQDGKIVYDPSGAFQTLGAGDTAVETLSYTVSDGQGGSAKAEATITVEGAGNTDAASAGPVTDVTDLAGLMAALKSATGGETIRLAAGDYGKFFLSLARDPWAHFDTPVTITSADGNNPAKLTGLDLRDVSGLTFDHLLFDYTAASGAPTYTNVFKVTGGANVSIRDSVFDGDLASGLNKIEDGYGTGHGLSVGGADSFTLDGNEFYNWSRAAAFGGDTNIKVINNNIHDIRIDGFNFVGVKDVLIENNFIHDFTICPGAGGS